MSGQGPGEDGTITVPKHPPAGMWGAWDIPGRDQRTDRSNRQNLRGDRLQNLLTIGIFWQRSLRSTKLCGAAGWRRAWGLAGTEQRGVLPAVGCAALPRCRLAFWVHTCSFQQDPAGPLCPPRACDSLLRTFRPERGNWGLEVPPNHRLFLLEGPPQPLDQCGQPWLHMAIRPDCTGSGSDCLG